MEGKCEEKKRVCVVEQKFGNSLIFSPLSIYTTYLCELGCLECLPFSYACHTTFCNVHTCYCYYVFSRCDQKIDFFYQFYLLPHFFSELLDCDPNRTVTFLAKGSRVHFEPQRVALANQAGQERFKPVRSHEYSTVPAEFSGQFSSTQLRTQGAIYMVVFQNPQVSGR